MDIIHCEDARKSANHLDWKMLTMRWVKQKISFHVTRKVIEQIYRIELV